MKPKKRNNYTILWAYRTKRDIYTGTSVIRATDKHHAIAALVIRHPRVQTIVRIIDGDLVPEQEHIFSEIICKDFEEVADKVQELLSRVK